MPCDFREATRDDLVEYLESWGFGVSSSACADKPNKEAGEREARENNG